MLKGLWTTAGAPPPALNIAPLDAANTQVEVSSLPGSPNLNCPPCHCCPTDGITDLEAVQATGGADLFIGYGGVIVREAVASAADWFVNSYDTLLSALKRYKVAMIGSGAWASAAARMLAQSVMADDPADVFDDEVGWLMGVRLCDVALHAMVALLAPARCC